MPAIDPSVFEIIFNQMPAPAMILEAAAPNFIIVAQNRQLQLLTSTPSESLVGKPLANMFALDATATASQERLTAILDGIRQCISEQKSVQLADVLRDCWNMEISPIANEQGQLSHLQCQFFKAVEKAPGQADGRQVFNGELATVNAQLSASEAKFRSIFAQAPVAIGVLRGRELIIETANAKLMEIWGNKADVINMPLAEALPEISDQPFLKILDEVITTGIPYYEYEIPAVLDHGGVLKKVYLDLLYHPLKDETGATESILVIASDLTEQVLARQKASRAETQLRLAVEAGNIGFWHIDPQTKALEYDVVLARIFGYEGKEPMTYDQAIGQVTEEHQDRILQHIEQAIETGDDYDITYAQRRFNDGTVIWLRSLGKVAPSAAGSGMVFAGIVMDVTEQKLDEERKNDFIGMVSHELKTPLTSLSGFLQLLQRRARKNGDTFTEGSTDRSLNQVRKMTTLINGFLNISKLESGKIDLNKRSFPLDELIREMLEEAMAIQSTHRINYSGCKVTVYADRDKIGNVISNLLNNAVKYAPGGKLVSVSCVLQTNFVQVSVADEGIGIAPEHLERLFQRFYRVQPNNDNISGFGIGLYLSAEIIRRHNGRIWAERTPGKGSVFHFTLPLKHETI